MGPRAVGPDAAHDTNGAARALWARRRSLRSVMNRVIEART